MKQALLSLLFVPAFYNTNAQDIKSYVKQNSILITTNHPDSVDFSDLELIGNAVGDARIVLLGEQDHGDAPAFLAKTRLIKYLHEKKGFNVLAFESDFFGLNYGWDNLPGPQKEVSLFLQTNIFPIWTYCDACQDLFKNYLPQTQSSASPLQITGFDNQMVLNYSTRFLSKKLDSVLRSYDLPITRELNYASEIVPLIDSCKKYKLKDETQFSKQLFYLQSVKEQLGKILAPDNFWMMLVDNLIAENEEYSNMKHFIPSFNTRDAQMAKNLLWLSRVKYPDEKIIVWAHNSHISKYAGNYGNRFLDEYKYMGSVFDTLKSPAITTYTIGFTSYKGSAGRIGTKIKEVRKPKKNGFENWINESYNFAFTDFRKFNAQNPGHAQEFFMKGHRHNGSTKASWNRIFDAVFFIREMYPCILAIKQ